MFTRHLKKFNNAAEMQAAIASGEIAAPYIAFESNSNIMNMTIPADKEPASIDYQQEGDDSSTGEDPTLTFNYVDVTYSTVADFIPAIYGDTSYYDSAAFFIVEQSIIDSMFNEHPGWSHGDALWSLIENNMIYPVTDASAGDTVSLASSLNAYYDSQNVYVFALLEHFENAVRDFYQPNATDDNYAYETVQWAEAAPTTTYFSMYIASQGFDPNDSSTYNVNISFSGYPGDMSWPYVTFGAYKVTEMTPYADTTAMNNVLGQDYDHFPAGGSGTYTLSIPIDLQPGESATYCVCAAPMNDMPATDMMYVDYRSAVVTVPSDEPVPSFAADGSAYISSTYTVPAGTDMGGWVTDNDMIYPTIVYGTTDATATDFMLGYYTAEDFASQTFPNQYYTSEEDYFNQAMWAYASGAQGTYDAYMMQADGISAVGNGDTYVFIGKFVQRENDMVLNSGPVIEIGRYPDDSSQGGDSSTDVSLGYKFSIGENNGGYFNTGYVPGADTVVQLRGTIIDDGAIAHGVKTGYGEWQYRIFGYSGSVYYDRIDDTLRLFASEDLTVPHDYEFGNFYIKIDGNTVASNAVDMSNFFTEQQLFVFAGSETGAMGESIPAEYAAAGTELEYFKILEPDGNGGLTLEMDLRPALDASGNICLYDQVAGDAIYPEGSSVNIIATAISGDEPGPDSSTSSNDIIAMHGNPGPTPTTVNPFITLVVDASIAALSSWDHMEVGIYSLNHYENNGYSSINDYRQNGFIKTCTIALTDGTAHYSVQSADDLDCNEIPAGEGYTFTGYDDTICVVAWFEIGYGAQQVAESNEIFELYEYELPSSSGGDSSILVPANPAVEYDNYSDDGAGTITFDAWLNADAIAAGAHHYSVGITSDVMKQTAMEDAMMNNEEWDPDAWMVTQCYGTYTGDSAAPNSITLGYSTTFDDQGQVIVVMYDSGDSIVQYNGADFQTIDGWSFTVPPEEPPMEPPMEEPIE